MQTKISTIFRKASNIKNFTSTVWANKKIDLQTKLLINGKFVNSKSGKKFDTINPATEKVIAQVEEADKEDIDLAVKSAREAFDNGPWRKISATERGKLIYKLVDLIEKNAEELAYIESIDSGKPIQIAKDIDVLSLIDVLRYYAGWADKIQGKTIPINGPYFCYTRHEPVGVCGQIIPWNFPLMMLGWKLGPLLALGCTTVLKPAEFTPLSALKFGELLHEAGFPPGVVNLVPGFGPTAGKALASHPLVDKVAFTGSTKVGLELMRDSHASGLKRITLEMGGKSPNIVMDDAVIDSAAQQSAEAVYFHMGQSCSALSRVYVHEKVYDRFVKKIVEITKKMKVGDPLSGDTDHGPLMNLPQKQKYMHYIKKGQEEGAKLETGGKVLPGPGFFVEPSVFSQVTDNMAIAREEIFTPIVSILKFKDVDDAIRRANNSTYGLAGAVFTKNIETAIKISNSVRTGSVWVNCYEANGSNGPFGGFKNSGLGRELGEYGLQNYTEVKTVIIKRPDDSLP